MAKCLSEESNVKKAAIRIIVLFGIVSIFGDMLYEGARSANGQYLELLGVSATTLGLVYGVGEFLGYLLRLISGYFSDKTGRQWTFIIFGYLTLIVVPMMGLTSNWQIIVILIILERIGKGLRSPPKDTVLSQVAETGETGLGRAFGIQETLDQVGALSGPLIFSIAFFINGKQGISEYQAGYLSLSIAFILLIFVLYLVFIRCKKYNPMVNVSARPKEKEKLTRRFWIFTLFASLAVMGLVNFSMIGYYLKAENILPDQSIVLLYALAMIVDAGVALLIGDLYDRLKKKSNTNAGGVMVLIFVPIITPFISLFGFSSSVIGAVIAMILFGIVMGAHETVVRSSIADITPFHKRGTAYGMFYLFYGLSFLIGSISVGLLYDHSSTTDISIMVSAIESLSMIIFLWMMSDIMKESLPKN